MIASDWWWENWIEVTEKGNDQSLGCFKELWVQSQVLYTIFLETIHFYIDPYYQHLMIISMNLHGYVIFTISVTDDYIPLKKLFAIIPHGKNVLPESSSLPFCRKGSHVPVSVKSSALNWLPLQELTNLCIHTCSILL